MVNSHSGWEFHTPTDTGSSLKGKLTPEPGSGLKSNFTHPAVPENPCAIPVDSGLKTNMHKAKVLSPVPTPKISSSPFMMAGDLLNVADGGHAETKGAYWDDYILNKPSVLIGRHKDCDLVLRQSGIASRHAQIYQYGGRYALVDYGSETGTYVNGRRISSPIYLEEKDHIALGSINFVFSGNRLIYAKADDAAFRKGLLHDKELDDRPVVLKTNIRSKRVRDRNSSGMKELIRDINLEVREGSLVAMLGTAGAGKSTVMNCMNGMELQGVEGSINYRGVELLNNFEQMKHLIGSVPQKKVIHPSFTPEEEFYQSAALRLPADTSHREIQERVEQTLELLSITGVRRNRNSRLSGGEQTRVNVGIELVADRDLLCLDEPEQGLSPNYKHELFTLLQNLCHNHGKTVISIIHDVSDIDMFDQVIFIAKVGGVGRLAFSGAPAAAREYFGMDIRDAYTILEREPQRFVK